MNKVKEEIINCATGEKTYKYYTDEEWEKVLKQQAEMEANRPLTDKEKIEKLQQENILLQDAVIELASIVGAEKVVSKLNRSLGN